MMCWCFSGCITLGGLAGEVALSNILARVVNDSLCVFPSVNGGLAGAGFFSSLIKSCAA